MEGNEQMKTTIKKSSDQKLAEVHSQLREAYLSIVEGERWGSYLTSLAKFHDYSARNVALILSQLDSASRVAGIKTWNSVGRRVKKGEPGLRIIVPTMARREVEHSDGSRSLHSELRGFRVGYCWDISQTEGEPLDEGCAPVLQREHLPDEVWEAICGVIREEGFRVEMGNCGGANGMTSFSSRVVTLAPHLIETGRVRTTLHELAHVLLHGGGRSTLDRAMCEVEAESVAYVVGTVLGIECESYSPYYLAHWASNDAGGVSLVEATAARVQATAQLILDRSSLLND